MDEDDSFFLYFFLYTEFQCSHEIAPSVCFSLLRECMLFESLKGGCSDSPRQAEEKAKA